MGSLALLNDEPEEGIEERYEALPQLIYRWNSRRKMKRTANIQENGVKKVPQDHHTMGKRVEKAQEGNVCRTYVLQK